MFFIMTSSLLTFYIICLAWITISHAETSLLDHLNFFVNQNRYTMQQPSTFQTKFSLDAVMSVSLDQALHSCQNDFKWERWNCPTADFFRRHSTNRYKIDREDAYVKAIITAAALYTITKDCSSGVTTGCGCDTTASSATPCSDDPEKAATLYTKYNQKNVGKDFRDLLAQHNIKAISTLLRQSLIRQCGCSTNGCSEQNCVNVLRPFNEIARDIKTMYDEGLQLTTGANTQIMWSNIPLDSLVYAAESPNYCDLDAVPHWPGMHGRQCSTDTNDEESESNSNSSCQHLCYECGYRVRAQNVVTERNCNCKFTWNFQVQCERCMHVEQQLYCY